MTSLSNAASDLDLSGCDKEPIRTPGSIQPHGFLLTLDAALNVLQASANLAAHAPLDAASAIGQSLGALLDAESLERIRKELAIAHQVQRPTYLCTVLLQAAASTRSGSSGYDVLAHWHDEVLILEFEQVEHAIAADFRHLPRQIGDFLARLNNAGDVLAMSAIAAEEIQAVSGFGRVMVYRFDPDGHGQVLAECRDPDYDSYLGQRFPGSDVPRQARDLYVLNRIRLIADANYTPALLVPAMNPNTGAPNDLTFATLRSVSPIHLQYMRNMGTLASMSVSIVVKGKLWGLIACHHATPRMLSFEKRTTCEQIGQILSLCVESREDAAELQFRLDLRRIMVEILSGLTQDNHFAENMRAVFPLLLRFARAGGVALLHDDRLLTFGETPRQNEIRALVSWLDGQQHDNVFHTDRLPSLYALTPETTRVASGLLAIPISRIHKHYLLWFRPEQVRTIDWAGDPRAKDHAAQGQPLHPRASFATWRETVHGTSLPWHDGEIELAAEFRTALLGIVLERAEQMAEMATELARANKELEAFSYSVSHDLRAPLRHIVGFSDLLLDGGFNDNVEKRERFLRNIKDSARLAGKLVDDLLNFSQMGRAALHPTSVDMADLVRTCIDKLTMDTRGRKVDWIIDQLPVVQADPSFLHHALFNLLSNAVKFTSGRERAVIAVRAQRDERETVFSISDNGAGFSMEYAHKLFGVFQRLHRMEDFPGTGIGLANVRRIIERHGGRTWAVGVPDQGATFSFSIPHELPN